MSIVTTGVDARKLHEDNQDQLLVDRSMIAWSYDNHRVLFINYWRHVTVVVVVDDICLAVSPSLYLSIIMLHQSIKLSPTSCLGDATRCDTIDEFVRKTLNKVVKLLLFRSASLSQCLSTKDPSKDFILGERIY